MLGAFPGLPALPFETGLSFFFGSGFMTLGSTGEGLGEGSATVMTGFFTTGRIRRFVCAKPADAKRTAAKRATIDLLIRMNGWII